MEKSASVAWEYLLVNAGDLAIDVGKACRELPRTLIGTLLNIHKTPPLYATLEESLDQLAKPYLGVLVESRRALRYVDEHGQVQHRAWSKELGTFITEIVMPRLGADTDFAWRRLPYVARRLDAMVAAADVAD